MEQEFEPKGKLKIRPATANDAQSLITYCFPMMDSEEVTKALEEDIARMAEGEAFRFVVEAGGCAIANVGMAVQAAEPSRALVQGLAVSAPFRGLDVATHLMKHMDSVAQANGITSLMIEIPSAETKVIDGFKRWGFTERPVVILEKTVVVQQELEGLDAGGNKDEA